MTTNFDNWKAGLTVEQFWAFVSETSCEFCPVENTCIGVSSCFDEFKRWAESEYIPPVPEKTKVEQLGDLLGVVVGEKFNLVWPNKNLLDLPVMLTEKAELIDARGDSRPALLRAIIAGEAAIEKIPQQPEEWKPKKKMAFWLVTWDGHVMRNFWHGTTLQLALWAMGNRFPTEEAAEAGKADVLAKFEAIRRELEEC